MPKGLGGPLKIWNKYDFAQAGFVVVLLRPYATMNWVPALFLRALL